jgi:TDG/mug DNA glycosylase family protein
MLKDVLCANLDVVFCGTAKGEASARLGYYYAGQGNKFYSILHTAGFTPIKLKPKNCFDINQFKIGLTDLVHNQAGNDKAILKENFDVDWFINKMKTYEPKFIGFTSKTAASFVMGYKGVTSLVEYGLQDYSIGSTKIFVLPSTSGSARRYWKESYWFELRSLLS